MNAEEKTKLIAAAIFHCNYGKRTLPKEAALELTAPKNRTKEYREQAKEALLGLALNNPERLREVANGLCWLKRVRASFASKRDQKREGAYDLLDAYATCAFFGASFPPTFSEVKYAFVRQYGKNKWDGGHDEDDPSHGDFSARKTLKRLGLPLKKMKPGRRKGSKSLVKVLRKVSPKK